MQEDYSKYLKPILEKVCPHCKEIFPTRDSRKIYCTRRCARKASDKRVREAETERRLKRHLQTMQAQIQRDTPWSGTQSVPVKPVQEKLKASGTYAPLPRLDEDNCMDILAQYLGQNSEDKLKDG